MTYDLETTIQLPDEEDVDVVIHFTVSYWGHPGTGPSLSYPGDPPEGPEFEITKITRLGNGVNITSEFEALAASSRETIEELVLEYIYDLEREGDYDEG